VTTKVKAKVRVGKDVDLSKTLILDRNGRRLTQVRAEKIARTSVARVVGRPSLTGAKKISPEIKARVPKALKIKIEREAKRRGETSSALIRQALEEFLTA
jgi:Ribbon-helix-helix protein, copG family